jgi:hypothetical protein
MPSVRMRIIVILVAIFPLIASQAMPQPQCHSRDFLKMAQDFIAKKFPYIDLAHRQPVTSESNSFWEVRYELPPDMLGFVPVVAIDKWYCVVVHAHVEQ